MKFERFVAMRYMLKRKGLFAVITTLIGVAGVSVGVAALITTLSVMNGFQSDIKEKIIGAQSHILVFGRMAKDVYPQKMQAVEALPDVEGAARRLRKGQQLQIAPFSGPTGKAGSPLRGTGLLYLYMICVPSVRLMRLRPSNDAPAGPGT